MLVISACGKKDEKSSALESVKKFKKMRILTDAVNLPFEFGKDTTVQGFDVEVGNEIAKDFIAANTESFSKDVTIEITWLNYKGYDHLFDMLANAEAEILISTITVDPKRTDKFAFSTPYYDSDDAIASRKDNRYDDLASLSGKKVGVVNGRPGDRFMTAKKGVTLVKFPSVDEALGALGRTEVDAVVADRPLLTYSQATRFMNITISEAKFNQYQYAVAVRKDDKTLLESVNKTLDRLKNSGTLVSLKKTWYDDVKAQSDKERSTYLNDEALKKAPKPISVTIKKLPGSKKLKSIDDLKGFDLVLEGPSGKYKSTIIQTKENSGTCEFKTPVPPGEYKLDLMKIFQTTAKVEIQEKSKNSLAMEIVVGNDLLITVK
jgi:arginine/lysine/histidine transporter system substrate-binding protein